MASHRTERLLNLVICLLATRRWLTKEQIRRAVPQYSACESDEAFDRMFERDKEDLRDLGVPLVTGSDSAWFDDETGYRIDRESYALPELSLTAAELAVLGLASRVWQQASLSGPAARAMTKLKALGVDPDVEALVGVEPRVTASEPAFDPIYAAARDRAPIRFRYRKPDGEVSSRHVEPWLLTSRGGHWYLLGHDRDRQAPRAFRLSRVLGSVRVGRPGSYEIPADLDPAELLRARPTPEDQRPARLLLRSGRGTVLRLRALKDPGDPAPGPGPEAEGWDRVDVVIGDVDRLAEEIAAHGPDVRVLDPVDLREAVTAILRGTLEAHR